MMNQEEIKKQLADYDYVALCESGKSVSDMWREIKKLNELAKMVGFPTVSKGQFLKILERTK